MWPHLRSLWGAVGFGETYVAAPKTAVARREAYERDGFVSGGVLLDGTALSVLRAEFDRIHAQGLGAQDLRIAEGPGRVFYRIADLHRRSAEFERLVQHPVLVARLAELTGLDSFRVLTDQVQFKPPQVGGRNAWHRDMPTFPLERPFTGLTAWIALDDATRQTGCMRMVPGSHRWGDAEDLAVEGDGWGLPGVASLSTYHGHPVEVVPRPVPAGHVHFHHAMVWHESGRNKTPNKRRAFAIHFAGADDRYRGNRWTKLEGLRDGDPLDAAAPLVVRARTP